ncbi:MAG: class I SAM-dependent methyltransferase [Alphaproteobacteria bacterium]|nr:class I SAM-dependent methyltransferase [Alphaproteobacteria bacterium]
MVHPLRLFYALARVMGGNLPTAWLEGLILTAINAKVGKLSAFEGLRFLFRLDNRLYEFQSRLAKDYGQGEHPKHRLTRYHDFFVTRLRQGERVLDVGCGQGQLAYAMASQASALVTGIDLRPDNIDVANARFSHPRLSFTVGDAQGDGLPSGQFDTVVLSNVLEHLPERPIFLRRLLAFTGAHRALLRVPMFERDWRIPLKQELGIDWRADPTHEIEHTRDSFVEEVEAAGLTITEELIRWGEIWVAAELRGEDRTTDR